MTKFNYTQYSQAINVTGDEPLLRDPRKYRGKGRPRKTDYSPQGEVMVYLQKKINKQYTDYIDKIILEHK